MNPSSPQNPEPDENEPDPWEKLPEENPKHWDTFCLYRDLGKTRSLSKLGQKWGKKGSHISVWCAKFRWVERAAAYDAEQERQLRERLEAERAEEHAAEIRDYRERARKVSSRTAEIALSFLIKGAERLKTLKADEIPVTLLPMFMRSASYIAKISLDLEAEAIGVKDLEQLYDEKEARESAAEGSE